MRKSIKMLISFACCGIFAACTNEGILENIATENESDVMTFTASFEEDTNTRTTSTSTNAVVWVEGDEISILDGTSNNRFVLVGGAGTSNCQFSGKARSVSNEYVALYPYKGGQYLEDGEVKSASIPTVQVATPNTFDPKANILTAKAVNGSLNFKNACSYIKVTPDVECTKIVICADNQTEVTGVFDAEINDDGIVEYKNMKWFSTSNSASLVPAEGKDVIEPGTYLIAVAGGCTMDGFTYAITTTDGTTKTFHYGKSITFKRHMIRALGKPSLTPNPDPEPIDIIEVDELKWSPLPIEDYYAWGETEVKYTAIKHQGGWHHVVPIIPEGKHDWEGLHYTADNWLHNGQSLEEYCNYNASNGVYTLKPEYDVAHVKLGENWRLPTIEELQYLRDNLYWIESSRDGIRGVSGYKVKQDSDRKINQPSAGYISNLEYTDEDPHVFFINGGSVYHDNIGNFGEQGWFWSSECKKGQQPFAFNFTSSGGVNLYPYATDPATGRMVIAVYDEDACPADCPIHKH